MDKILIPSFSIFQPIRRISADMTTRSAPLSHFPVHNTIALKENRHTCLVMYSICFRHVYLDTRVDIFSIDSCVMRLCNLPTFARFALCIKKKTYVVPFKYLLRYYSRGKIITILNRKPTRATMGEEEEGEGESADRNVIIIHLIRAYRRGMMCMNAV